MISLIVVSLGAVAAVLGTGLLAARCARAPRLFLVAWTVALFGLTIALGAQALGYLGGYTGITFRAMELGAQAIAPLGLCLGLTELLGRSVPARFAMRLAVCALAVIMVVILGTDPLNPNATFSKSWASPSAFFDPPPKVLIVFLAAFTLCTVLIAFVLAQVRASRDRQSQARRGPAILCAGAAILVALPGLSVGVHLPLAGGSTFALACVAAVALIWLAARAADRSGLVEAGRAGAGRAGAGAGRAGAGRAGAGRDGAGLDGAGRDGAGRDGRRDPRGSRHDDDFDRSGRAPNRGDRYDLDPDYPGGPYGDDEGRAIPEPAGAGRRPRDPDSEFRYPGLAALAADQDEAPADAGWRDEPGRYDESYYDDSGMLYEAGRPDDRGAGYDAGYGPPDGYGEPDSYAGNGGFPVAAPASARGPLFGQITIYTLIDDRIEDFDLVTEHVVEQVRAQEPGTLVYIVHAVPTAPMQRILYEVYQDRAAYQEHLSQPYVAMYESERRRYVLATNVIELGLQQAKVTPLPSYSAISEMLSESGIDLTGVTGRSRSATQATNVLRSPHGAVPAPAYPQPDPRDAHLAGPGRYDYEPGADAAPEPGFEGWADIRRDDDQWYR